MMGFFQVQIELIEIIKSERMKGGFIIECREIIQISDRFAFDLSPLPFDTEVEMY